MLLDQCMLRRDGVMELKLNNEKSRALVCRIADASDVPINDCYQCGICSSGCPMSLEMDIMPRHIMRYMQLGVVDEVLKSKAIWLCAACYTCKEICPNSISITMLMEIARQEAHHQLAPEVISC